MVGLCSDAESFIPVSRCIDFKMNLISFTIQPEKDSTTLGFKGVGQMVKLWKHQIGGFGIKFFGQMNLKVNYLGTRTGGIVDINYLARKLGSKVYIPGNI